MNREELRRSRMNHAGKVLGRTAMVCACAAIAACGSHSGSARSGGPLVKVTPADFMGEQVVGEAPAEQQGVSLDDPDAVITASPSRGASSDGVYDITAGSSGTPQGRPGGIIASDAQANPDAVIRQPVAVGVPVLVDAKIGDINGKPIFASDFFDSGTPTQTPLGPRLAAEARKIGTGEGRITLAVWRRTAREQIAQSLDQLIEDELLRAEALSTFTAEQKQGFFAFMQRLQADVQRQYGGSRERLNEELESREGMSADQYFSQREQRELVRFQLTEKIYKRVNVTWRDIAQAYERFNEDFNPPPTLNFRMLTVPKDRAEDIERMKAEIASGKSIIEIAKSPLNRWKPREGGLEARQLKTELAKAEFFAVAPLNDAAKALRSGETSQPIEFGQFMAWLHLESIDEKRVPLYEAQLALENYLRDQKATAERRKYMSRLKARASITDEGDMRTRLLQIAEDRFLPVGSK